MSTEPGAAQTSVHWLNLLLSLNASNHKCSIALDEQLRLSELHRRLLNAVAQDFPGQVTVFDTIPALCDKATGNCSAYINGRPIYGTTDHISDYAAGLVGAALNSQIQQR